jgi:DNA-binding NtrC family response regulator
VRFDQGAIRRCRSLLRRLREKLPKPEILAVLHDSQSGSALRESLPRDWGLEIVDSCEAALDLGARHPFNTIILDQDLAHESLREAVTRFSTLPTRPVVLLFSDGGTHTSWEELSQCGAYGRLQHPFPSTETNSTIYAGWLLWNNQDLLRRDQRRRIKR